MKNDTILTWKTIYKGTIAEGAACPYCGKRGYYHEDKCQYCGKRILPQKTKRVCSNAEVTG